jgi:hypothetical protein
MSGDKIVEDHGVGVDSAGIESRYEVLNRLIILLKVFLKSAKDIASFVRKPKIHQIKWDIFLMKCRCQWHALYFVGFEPKL